MQNSTSPLYSTGSSRQPTTLDIPDQCRSRQRRRRPRFDRPCSVEFIHERNYHPRQHRSTSDLFETRSECASPDDIHWSPALCQEGHVYNDVGMIFEDDYFFPPNVTFASRTVFKGACFFGAGSTFESKCVFEKTCCFGAHCVFDSSSIFKMPCVFNKACTFGKFSQTAQNSMFSSDCKLISETASIIEITPKAETSGFKEDIIKQLERNPECVVCKKRNKTHILLPCGHLVVCKQCSKKDSISGPGTGQCPVCKRHVEKVQKPRIGL